MDTKLRATRSLLLAVGLVLCGGWVPATAQEVTDTAATICGDCHAGLQESRLDALNHADTITCRSCHHVGFTNDPRLARLRRVEQCATCHSDLLQSHSGIGDRAPECTECHAIHVDEAQAPVEVASARCGVCHSEAHAAHVPLQADAPLCADCHTVHSGLTAELPVPDAATAECTSCHESVHPGHDTGDGRFGAPPGSPGAPHTPLECVACHTAESGFALAEQEERDARCTECHDQTVPDHAGHTEADVTCLGCHDLRVPLPGRRGQAAMNERCGACHEEPRDAYLAGAHAEQRGDVSGPGCASCHRFSEAAGGERDPFRRRLNATVLCMDCHEKQATLVPDENVDPGTTYEDDFHGATVLFLARESGQIPEDAEVLLCSDCHGVHDVSLMDRSEVAPVCDRCHADVGDKLAGAWLGHQRPSPRNATVVWLVKLFYTFLIPFMLSGLLVVIVFQLMDQRRKGARMWTSPGLQRLLARLRGRGEEKAATVSRFSRSERLEHLGSMVTFILLVVTGLPQTRPDLSVAQAIIDFFGGIWMTRIVHRVVGVAFVLLMVVHVTRAVVRAIRERRLPVMVPTRQDFADVVASFKHYVAGGPAPKVGKFDFAQKFEYWGLFLGGIVMSGSGLVLFFPELFTQILPGVLIAAIRTMHGLEATFAVLVVVLWHSYGVILRPEVFPLDTTIFTGRMRLDRLKHEHALEYERLLEEGELE